MDTAMQATQNIRSIRRLLVDDLIALKASPEIIGNARAGYYDAKDDGNDHLVRLIDDARFHGLSAILGYVRMQRYGAFHSADSQPLSCRTKPRLVRSPQWYVNAMATLAGIKCSTYEAQSAKL